MIVDPLDAAAIKPPKKSPQSSPVQPTAAVVSPPPKRAAQDIQVDPGRYMVMKAARVSIHGNMTTLAEGKVISETSYGPGTIQRLKDCGVELTKE